MEEHSTWFIDVPRLTRDLSIASGPDKSKWNWIQMRDMLERVYSNPSPDTKHYLALIRKPETDTDTTRDLLEHFRDDLPRWFQVVIAPALSSAGSIARYPSVVPPMLEASGWPKVDAVAVLMGDPLASLAREIGLSLIASELTETRVTGWLSTNRVADLNSKLNMTLRQPDNAIRAAVKAAAAYWNPEEAEKAARDALNDVRQILARADSERRPLCVAYDA
jgi:hypothetical protein